jgi:hypothetical protein
LILILGLLLAAGSTFVSAAQDSLDVFMHSAASGANLPLLGPIDEVGRNGWNCTPERAAQSPALSDAGLASPAP